MKRELASAESEREKLLARFRDGFEPQEYAALRLEVARLRDGLLKLCTYPLNILGERYAKIEELGALLAGDENGKA